MRLYGKLTVCFLHREQLVWRQARWPVWEAIVELEAAVEAWERERDRMRAREAIADLDEAMLA